MGAISKLKNEKSARLLYAIGVSLLFILCSRSLQIYFIQETPILRTVYTNLSRLCALGIFGLLLLHFKELPKKLYLCLGAFYGLLLLTTILGGGDLRRWLGTAYPALALNGFILLECRSTPRIKQFLKALSDLFLVLVGLNTLFMIFFPNLFGTTSTTSGHIYLLGLENQLIYPLTIGLLILLLNDYFNQDKFKLQLYAFLYIVSALINFSVGSLMGVAVLLLYFGISPIKRFFEKHPLSVFLGIFAVIFIVLVFFADPVFSFPPLRCVIEEILHKDITLTHRTNIWKVVVSEVLESPIFGYGYRETGNLFTVIAWGKPKTFSAHNQYLQTWYEGGTITILMLIAFLLVGSSLLKRLQDKKLAGTLKAITLSIMIMLLVEAPAFNSLFFTITLGATIALTLQKEQTKMTALHHPLTKISEELISVVIPVYNVETYLEECLQSVVDQTYQNLQIILVNDGSTDGSLTICKSFAQKDQRILALSQENAGLSAARNTGIKAATGKYITFIDSDDAIHPDMIEHLHNMLKQHNADMTVCQKEFTNEESKAIPCDQYYPDRIISGNRNCMKFFFEDNGLDTTAWGKLYKTEMFAEISYPEGKYHEDIYTTYRLIALCDKIVTSAQRLYFYRQRTGSIIHASFSPKHLDAVEGSLLRAEFISAHYPPLKTLAQSKIIYTANSCVLKLMRCDDVDPKTVEFLQKQYRTYEKSFLLGNSKASAKLFSLFAYCNLGLVLKLSKSLRKLRRKISK